MTLLTLDEIKGLTTEQLVIRKPVVVRSLERHLEIFRATDPAVELIEEWSRQEGIRNAIAYDLQPKLAEEIGRSRCSVCRWVKLPGQSCCDDRDMDFNEPFDKIDPDHVEREEIDQDLEDEAALVASANLDDTHLEIDRETTYVMTRI